MSILPDLHIEKDDLDDKIHVRNVRMAEIQRQIEAVQERQTGLSRLRAKTATELMLLYGKRDDVKRLISEQDD